MNLILIIIDSLRADHVGINGNSWIRTPAMDALAEKSVRFTNSYPESLMTIPVRKAIHTGKRTFPFRDWEPYSHWPAPGWTPIPEEDVTLSEILQEKGYTTALVTDVYHTFKPGMNFHRGFDEWRWIRGQEFDHYRSGSRGDIDTDVYFTANQDRTRLPAKLFPKYLKNVELRKTEDDYFTPQVFKSATRWLEENYRAEKFFLCIDNFDPHEPWDPPQYYRDMYDVGYKGKEVILPIYMENFDYLTDAELNHIRALYAGEVTMVDTWLGYFLNKVDQLGLMDNSLIVLISDHGHLLGENNAIGKVTHCLYPGLMDLVFFIKHPGQSPKTIYKLVYNHDVFPTIFHLLGEEVPEQAEGKNLWELLDDKTDGHREYITSRAKEHLFVRTHRYVLICRADCSEPQLYDIQEDPDHEKNIAEENPGIVKKLYGYLLKDTDGEVPTIDIQWTF